MEEIKIMLRKRINTIGGFCFYENTLYNAIINEKGEISLPIKGDKNFTVGVLPNNAVICKSDDGFVQYHRKPTNIEIRIGYGATHYISIPESICRNKEGNLKKRCKYKGEMYYL